MVLSLPPLRPSVRPLPVLPYCAPHSIAPGPDWLQMLLLRAVDWCRPRRCRGLSSSCSSLCAAGSRAARMRPKAWPPRPPKGCRRTRGSIVVVPSFSIHLSLCSTGFHRLHCSYEEIRLLHGHRPVVVASFGSTARADPHRPPWVRTLDVPQPPAPLTASASVGFWASRSKTRLPGRSGLLRSSLSFGATVCLGLLPHTASRRQQVVVSRRRQLRAVASGSRLLPTRPAKDLHLQSSAHARHTFSITSPVISCPSTMPAGAVVRP